MGWSCATAAAYTMDAWSDECHKQTTSANSYIGTDGQNYFYETSRREHDDGAITGSVWVDVRSNPGFVRKSGSFRINGDGTVAKYPTAWPFPKNSQRTP